MSVSTVEVYEKLKPSLGEEGTKALLSYVEETAGGVAITEIKGEIATIKEKVGVIEGEIAIIKEKVGVIEGEIAVIKATMATKEDIHQLRLLIVVVIAVVILLNPKIWEVIGTIFGVVK